MTALLLIVTLFIATSFDYLWIGPVPLWTALPVLGLIAIVIDSGGRQAAGAILAVTGFGVLLPWLGFIALAGFLLSLHGAFDESFMRVIVLGLASVLLFFMTAVWARLTTPLSILRCLAAIALLQGLLAVMQALGSEAAWRLPADLATLFRGDAYGARSLEAETQSLVEIGRARGTHVAVHKFAAVQGALAAFLITFLILASRLDRIKGATAGLLIGGALFGVIGTALTFSRSVGLGLALVFILASLRSANLRSIAASGFFALLALASFALIGIDDQAAAGRMFDFSLERETNAARVEHVKWSLAVIQSSPLFGDLSAKQSLGLPVHSVPLRILTDFGIAGFLLYLLALMGVVNALRPGKTAGGDASADLRRWSFAGLCVVLVTLIDAVTHSSGFMQTDIVQPALYGTLIGVVAGLRAKAKTAIAPQAPGRAAHSPRALRSRKSAP